mmetsp:Transcript_474/g.982  ORF Transcript_474/g.982 Transcript_474/m.982 type:complete len:438 (+) Transcript_474:395-1708(+)
MIRPCCSSVAYSTARHQLLMHHLFLVARVLVSSSVSPRLPPSDSPHTTAHVRFYSVCDRPKSSSPCSTQRGAASALEVGLRLSPQHRLHPDRLPRRRPLPLRSPEHTHHHNLPRDLHLVPNRPFLLPAVPLLHLLRTRTRTGLRRPAPRSFHRPVLTTRSVTAVRRSARPATLVVQLRVLPLVLFVQLWSAGCAAPSPRHSRRPPEIHCCPCRSCRRQACWCGCRRIVQFCVLMWAEEKRSCCPRLLRRHGCGHRPHHRTPRLPLRRQPSAKVQLPGSSTIFAACRTRTRQQRLPLRLGRPPPSPVFASPPRPAPAVSPASSHSLQPSPLPLRMHRPLPKIRRQTRTYSRHIAARLVHLLLFLVLRCYKFRAGTFSLWWLQTSHFPAPSPVHPARARLLMKSRLQIRNPQSSLVRRAPAAEGCCLVPAIRRVACSSG